VAFKKCGLNGIGKSKGQIFIVGIDHSAIDENFNFTFNFLSLWFFFEPSSPQDLKISSMNLTSPLISTRAKPLLSNKFNSSSGFLPFCIF